MSCRISLHIPIDQTAFKDSKAGCFRPLLLGISPDSRLDVIIVTSGFFTDPESNKSELFALLQHQSGFAGNGTQIAMIACALMKALLH
jgi:hypothetical protein